MFLDITNNIGSWNANDIFNEQQQQPQHFTPNSINPTHMEIHNRIIISCPPPFWIIKLYILNFLLYGLMVIL